MVTRSEPQLAFDVERHMADFEPDYDQVEELDRFED